MLATFDFMVGMCFLNKKMFELISLCLEVLTKRNNKKTESGTKNTDFHLPMKLFLTSTIWVKRS